MNRILLFVTIVMVTPLYGFFYEGDLVLGVTLGGGNSEYSSGKTGAVANFSAEVIIDSWYFRDVSLSVGALANGSVFFKDDWTQGGLSLMPTFHLNFLESVDWYIGLGFGITMHQNIVQYGAGFSSGFNVLTKEWVLIGLGVELQGTQVFGSVGFKFLI